MVGYQVAVIPWPEGWKPECPDDVPPAPGEPLDVLAEAEDLFVAVRQAIEHNQRAEQAGTDRWAVVVEPGSRGRTWPTVRLCTPISYKVAAIWWPEGWEPASPLDVPGCAWQARSGAGEERLTYSQAENSVRALNRQCVDQPGTTWYVVVGVENEPISQSVAYDASGTETTVEVRRLHVIRLAEGGRGDCSCCPAHSLPCADGGRSIPAQTITVSETRHLQGESA